MRLKEEEINVIKRIILEFDANAKIYLFGSRADDAKKGGDIDLLVFSTKIDNETKRMIKLKLYDKLGEQKIDILVAKDAKKPFVRIALEKGVIL